MILENSEEKEGRNFIDNWWDITPGRRGTAGAKALGRRFAVNILGLTRRLAQCREAVQWENGRG